METNGVFILLASMGGNAVFITIAIFVIRSIVKSGIQSMRDHCNTVSSGILKTINGNKKSAEKEQDAERTERTRSVSELFDRIHKHGHQGLKGEDAKVTV